LLAFEPALHNQFLDWDDLENFTNNANFRGLGGPHLAWMWTTTLLGHYVPVTWMSLGLDYLVWGMDPLGYHLTNVLLHAANAVIFYFIALRLLGAGDAAAGAAGRLPSRLAAAFAALVFAVHPLRGESVAWVTERRDVLSGLFYLLAVLAYLRDSDARNGGASRRWYWISLVWFVMALLSKAITVTLPFVLIVLDVYPLRRLGRQAGGWWSPAARRRLAEKIPFLLGSALIIPIAFVAARSGANLLAVTDIGVLERVAICLYGLTFYLQKTLLPMGLSPFYPLDTPIVPLSAPFFARGGVVAVITGLAILSRRRWPGVSAAWIVYVATLLPVSGIFQNGPQIVADRYSYLPSLPLAALAGAGALACWQWCERGRSQIPGFAALGVAVLSVSLFASLTWQHVGVWHDSERLWSNALETTPSSVVHSHLAFVRRQQGRWPEANEHYRQAAAMRPEGVDIQINWGTALAQQGRFGDAIDRYREALRLRSQNSVPHYFWANALFSLGDVDEAIRHYREAARLDPGSAETYNNWGTALAQQGDWDEAIGKYREALRIKPDYPLASANLAKVLDRQRLHLSRPPRP
jgi:Flp pilus assembly protein TadD